MNEQEMKLHILELLKEYPTLSKKIALLRFELEHPPKISDVEMMDAMMFSKGDGESAPSVGHVSDKTCQIALTYKEKADKQNQLQIAEIASELESIERKRDRLEYCVSQLPEEQAIIIRGIYFECNEQKKMANDLHLSDTTIKRSRAKAVDALTDMYLTLQKAGAYLEW